MYSAKPPKVLIDQDFAEISHDESNGVLITKWKGSLDVEQVRSMLEFKSAYIRTHGIRNNINDHADLKALSPAVQQYLVEEGHFCLERAGLRKIAVMLARDIFTQATVRRVNRVENYGALEIEVFATYEDAYAWLLS